MDNQNIQIQTPKKGINFKVVLIVLGVLILAEVVWGIWQLAKGSIVSTLNTSKTSLTSIPAEIKTKSATLSLQSTKTNIKVGEQVKVDILLDTGGKITDGTDIIINFDPKVLSVESASASGKVEPVVAGNLYTSYPNNFLDKSGKITFSAISMGKGFSGQGSLGSINFKALARGQTTISIDFSSGKTTDSNVIESQSAQDLLSEVKNLSLVVN